MSDEMIDLLDRFGVECIDLLEHGEGHSASQMRGWESKAYALLHSRFKEVILLDADVVPLRDPSDLFNLPRYQQTGAVFWPDINTLPPHAPIWDICRVPYRDEPEFESGQIVVDKEQTWEALHLALHLNELSSFYYKYLRGDKDTFHRRMADVATRIRHAAVLAGSPVRPAEVREILSPSRYSSSTTSKGAHSSSIWREGLNGRPGART